MKKVEIEMTDKMYEGIRKLGKESYFYEAKVNYTPSDFIFINFLSKLNTELGDDDIYGLKKEIENAIKDFQIKAMMNDNYFFKQ